MSRVVWQGDQGDLRLRSFLYPGRAKRRGGMRERGGSLEARTHPQPVGLLHLLPRSSLAIESPMPKSALGDFSWFPSRPQTEGSPHA